MGGGHLNATLATTTSAVARAVQRFARCPLDSGITTALAVTAPEASIVNCTYPLAVGGALEHTYAGVLDLTTECLNGGKAGA